MTVLLRAALPLATLLVVPLSTAEARTPAPSITVTAPAETLQGWTGRIGQSIGEQMRYPAKLTAAPEPQGVVDVAFTCSDDGTPADVTVARSSGSKALDRAGLQAVSRVKSLHPLPAGIGHDQVYRAQLLFAVDDGTGQSRRLAALRAKADAGNAALMARRGPATAAVVTLVPAGSK